MKKIIKPFCIATLSLAISITNIIPVFATPIPTNDIVVISGDTVNVRSDANTNSQVLGKLNRGTTVARFSTDTDGWSMINYNGTIGYIKNDFIASSTTPDVSTAPQAPIASEIPSAYPIFIYGIDIDVNSAGGVDTHITWKNMSPKEMKYVTFYVQYYNSVKDVISNDIGRSTVTRLKETGPFPYGKGSYDYYSVVNDFSTGQLQTICHGYYFDVTSGFEEDKANGWAGTYWKAPFYNYSARYIKVTKIDIQYMDGSKQTYSDAGSIAAMVGNGIKTNSWSTSPAEIQDDYLR